MGLHRWKCSGWKLGGRKQRKQEDDGWPRTRDARVENLFQVVFAIISIVDVHVLFKDIKEQTYTGKCKHFELKFLIM